jgi:hypothetical protein
VVERKQLYRSKNPLAIIYLLMGIAMSANLFSQSDTAAKKVKVPKHYFTPTVYADFYNTPQIAIRLTNAAGKPLQGEELRMAKLLRGYQYSQSVGGFYFPLITKEKVHEDQRISNFHLLATGSYMLAMPRFGGPDSITKVYTPTTSKHNLMKASLGMRGIYNSGKKGIWFFDATPFIAGDLSASGTMVARWASTIVYDRMVSRKFSYRVGITRTFILGNRYNLPYLGLRVGRLDRAYLSVQFPRFISFSFPIGSKIRASVYTKATGSILTMANNDSLYNGTNGKTNTIDKTIIFGRYDGNTGFRFDFNFSKHFSLYAAFGGANLRAVALFSNQYNAKNNTDKLVPFFGQKLDKVGYINFGFVVRIGQAKSVYGNHNMYEVFNANSTIDVGDNNTDTGDGNIPNETKKKTITNLKTRDVQDLIEAQDLY